MLRSWMRAERVRRGESGTSRKNTKDDRVSATAGDELEAENAALRAELKTPRTENQKLATERDILHKATKCVATKRNWRTASSALRATTAPGA